MKMIMATRIVIFFSLMIILSVTLATADQCPADDSFVPQNFNMDAQMDYRYNEAGLQIFQELKVTCDGYLNQWRFIPKHSRILGLHLAVFRERADKPLLFDIVGETYIDAVTLPDDAVDNWVFYPVEVSIPVKTGDLLGFYNDILNMPSAMLTICNARPEKIVKDLPATYVFLKDASTLSFSEPLNVTFSHIDYRFPALTATVSSKSHSRQEQLYTSPLPRYNNYYEVTQQQASDDLYENYNYFNIGPELASTSNTEPSPTTTRTTTTPSPTTTTTITTTTTTTPTPTTTTTTTTTKRTKKTTTLPTISYTTLKTSSTAGDGLLGVTPFYFPDAFPRRGSTNTQANPRTSSVARIPSRCLLKVYDGTICYFPKAHYYFHFGTGKCLLDYSCPPALLENEQHNSFETYGECHMTCLHPQVTPISKLFSSTRRPFQPLAGHVPKYASLELQDDFKGREIENDSKEDSIESNEKRPTTAIRLPQRQRSIMSLRAPPNRNFFNPFAAYIPRLLRKYFYERKL